LRALQLDYTYGEKRSFNYFLMSDTHFFAHDFAEKVYHKNMKEAVSRDADIILNGDIFEAIFPNDKRFVNGCVNTKQQAIMNAMLKDARELLMPYRKNIKVISLGNHDTKIIKVNSFDPVYELIGQLNLDTKFEPIQYAGYGGFLQLIYRDVSRSGVRIYTIAFKHSHGGANPFTSLKNMHWFDADMRWVGHCHKQGIIQMDTKVGVNQVGQIYTKPILGVFTGCYKNELNLDSGTYQTDYVEEKLSSIPHQGGCFLNIVIDGSKRLVATPSFSVG
jgi:hypothetical protein